MPSASSAVSFAYQYNGANQRTHATLADGSSWSYAYDDLGQVTSANHTAADGTPMPGEQFGYAFDDIGNRQETTETSRSVASRRLQATYAPNALNQYTARTVPDDADPTGLANPPEQFQYDADGNLIQDARWSYGWDAENRLVAMVSSGAPGLTAGQAGRKQLLQFDYDWQGRRIRKRVWNNPAGHGNPDVYQRFCYDGWNLIAILSSDLRPLSSFTWGLDLSSTLQGAGGVGGLLMVKDTAQGNHFVAYDGNGNVTGLVRTSPKTSEEGTKGNAVEKFSDFASEISWPGP